MGFEVYNEINYKIQDKNFLALRLTLNYQYFIYTILRLHQEYPIFNSVKFVNLKKNDVIYY